MNGDSFDNLCARLPRRHAAFVYEYVDCLSPKTAARRAGYSAKAAHTLAWKLRRRPDVAAAIDAGLHERNQKAQNDADRIIRELMLIAYADIRDLVDENGDLLDLADLPPEVRRALASVEVLREKTTTDGNTTTTTRIVRYRFAPKLHALELLGKRLKMFNERLELGSGDSLAALMQNAFGRPRPVTKNDDQR